MWFGGRPAMFVSTERCVAGIDSHYEYQYFEIRSCWTLLQVQRHPLPLWCCRIIDGPATRLPHLIVTDVVPDLLFVSCLGCSKSSSQVAVLYCSSSPHLKAVVSAWAWTSSVIPGFRLEYTSMCLSTVTLSTQKLV